VVLILLRNLIVMDTTIWSNFCASLDFAMKLTML